MGDVWFETYALGRKMVVHAEHHDFLGSDEDLERLAAAIALELPQRMLRFDVGAGVRAPR